MFRCDRAPRMDVQHNSKKKNMNTIPRIHPHDTYVHTSVTVSVIRIFLILSNCIYVFYYSGVCTSIYIANDCQYYFHLQSFSFRFCTTLVAIMTIFICRGFFFLCLLYLFSKKHTFPHTLSLVGDKHKLQFFFWINLFFKRNERPTK